MPPTDHRDTPTPHASSPLEGLVQTGASHRPHPIQWVIAGSLVVIAATLMIRTLGPPEAPVQAQPVMSAGARGVFAFSGQLSKTNYGVFVVDVDAMTIWAYEYMPQKGCMRLAAARSWRYDRYLENFNLCGPPPGEIEQLIEKQRLYKLQPDEEEKNP